MAGQAELSYTGIVDTLATLDKEFELRKDTTAPMGAVSSDAKDPD